MAACEKCNVKGVRQNALLCTTEFEIQISRFGASYWPYLFLRSPMYWKKFRCAGRSPNDPKWMQHQFPTIPWLAVLPSSRLGGVRSAFEAQKHKKYAEL